MKNMPKGLIDNKHNKYIYVYKYKPCFNIKYGGGEKKKKRKKRKKQRRELGDLSVRFAETESLQKRSEAFSFIKIRPNCSI